MKNIKILLLLLSLTACNNKTKTISTLDLEKVVINYKELPAPVKKKVFPPNNGLITFGEENREEYESFQETNNPKKYEYYTKQDPQLAWVHYPYIRNKKQSKNILLIKMDQWEVDTLFMEILYTFQIIITYTKKIV